MPYGEPVQPDDDSIAAAKTHLRVRLIASRRARDDAERRTARDANAAHLLAGLAGVGCVAAYLPLPTEPLAVGLLDELATVARVLVPVVVGDAPLDWCEYPVPLRAAALGIDEPTGPRLGPRAIGDADAILVPALAVDRSGNRLGRGGGHYDRTLELQTQALGAGANRSSALTLKGLRIAVLFDDELLEAIPIDELDQRVDATVTPAGGLRPVG